MIFGLLVTLAALFFKAVNQRYLEIGLTIIISGLAGTVGYFIDLFLENQTTIGTLSLTASTGLIILGYLKIRKAL